MMSSAEILVKLRVLAEKSGEEVQTRAFIDSQMQTLGGYSRAQIGQSLIYSHGDLDRGKVVAIRGDMDAVMTDEGYYEHRCGHHGHTAILLEVARRLEGSDKPFILLFQSAEETAQGAPELIESGFFERYQPSVMIGFHNFPGFEENHIILEHGHFNHSVVGFKCQLMGKASHAGNPEHGRSPAYALAKLVQEMEKQGEMGMKISITHMKLGEYQFGTMSGSAVILGTIRALEDSLIENGLATLSGAVGKYAWDYGLDGSFETFEYFKGVQNSPEVVDRLQEIFDGKDYVTTGQKEPFRAGEDFGFYLDYVPGCYIGIGTGLDAESLHTDNYCFNGNIVPFTAKLLSEIIEDYFEA